MIYLFNSGFQPLYRRNIRKTMFLPSGAANQYRYRSNGERQNISRQVIASLRATKRGAQAAVIFIDRFAAEGYRFIPLRLAGYLDAWPDGDRHFVAVQLRDYVMARDLAAFNQKLVAALGEKGLPRRVGDGSDSTNDGEYVTEGPDPFQDTASYEFGQAAWEKIVSELYQAPIFKKADEGLPLFCRCRFRDEKAARKTAKALVSGTESCIQLTRGKGYIAELYYKIGDSAQKTAGLRIELRHDDGIIVTRPGTLAVDADSNTALIRVKPKIYAEEPTGSLEFLMCLGDKEVPDSAISVPYEIKAKWTYLPWLIGLVVVFALCSAVKSYDLSKHLPSTMLPQGTPATPPSGWYNQLMGFLAPVALPVKVVAELVQVVTVILFVRISGKKPV